jgi:hypothetical protein
VLFLSCANLATSATPPNTPATTPAAFPIVSNEPIRLLFPATLPIAFPTVSNFVPIVLPTVTRFLLSNIFEAPSNPFPKVSDKSLPASVYN